MGRNVEIFDSPADGKKFGRYLQPYLKVFAEEIKNEAKLYATETTRTGQFEDDIEVTEGPVDYYVGLPATPKNLAVYYGHMVKTKDGEGKFIQGNPVLNRAIGS